MNREQASKAQFYGYPCHYKGQQVYIWSLNNSMPTRAQISPARPVAVRTTKGIEFKWVGVDELEVTT